MHILFVTTAHNSLSQRLAIELGERGHSIAVCLATSGERVIAAADRERPDLIVAPMLKSVIPERVWRQYTCLIVHPGVKGDRGASSLDWAISLGMETWGVTVLQAIAEMDAGPIWSSRTFRMPARVVSKSSLYRAEVTEAAVSAVLEAVARFESRSFVPEPLDYSRADVTGSLRPHMKQKDRAIDWRRDSTREIARKVRAADSNPGVLTRLFGHEVYVFGVHEEEDLRGPVGEVLGQRNGAVCIGTVDGAVWITHVKSRATGIKLPAMDVFDAYRHTAPHLDLHPALPADFRSWREIHYREHADVGYLSFEFYNGAMNTDQCHRLRTAFAAARSRPTKVICLLGGRDFWSNGIHLNTIEAAADPAHESWRNIVAMDDLVRELLTTPGQLVVSAMRGNAGAGGAMLALAADQVFAARGVVLNPHYKTMGLYGSEYWTYTLPRRVGWPKALDLTEACRPVGTDEAKRIGLIDDAFGTDRSTFEQEVYARVEALAKRADFADLLAWKHRLREADERAKPLAEYRAEELTQMWQNFFGPVRTYHDARHRFVHKIACAETTPEPRLEASVLPKAA
jgi:putative two-component system hydrogenase maturation factor HypX/HoxX